MKNKKPVRIVRGIVIVIWILCVTFPIYWTLVTSFKTQIDIYNGPFFFPGIDFTPTLESWDYLFSQIRDTFLLSLKNSVLISLISSLLALVIGGLAAYGLTRYEYKYLNQDNEGLAFTILSQRMMPPIVAVIALFIMFSNVNLIDNMFGMIIVYTWMNLPIVVYLLRDFFAGIPVELEQAAAIDGYSKFHQLKEIVLPLAAPGLATCFTLAFNFAWNEFLFALIMTYQKATTIPVLISSLNAQEKPQWAIISALGIVAVIPPAIIAIVMDKYLVQGLSFGSATK